MDVREFVAANDFELEDLLRMSLLAPGESYPVAGGAAPLTFLRRVA